MEQVLAELNDDFGGWRDATVRPNPLFDFRAV